MDTTGRLVSVARDIVSKKLMVSFVIDTEPVDDLNNLAQMESLDIKAEKHKKRRSLDANAYFHVLVGKIAEKDVRSKAWEKNMMICRYGQPELLPDGSPMVYKTNAPYEYMMELESLHTIPVKFSEENGQEVGFYKIYRGSHTYDTHEMSKLIEGTVAEAKERGIETLTPVELERMTKAWRSKNEAS